jgi:histone H1/5
VVARLPSCFADQTLSHSRQAIKKYIQANNTLTGTTEAAFSSHLARALKSGEENGVFERPKGMTSSFPLIST